MPIGTGSRCNIIGQMEFCRRGTDALERGKNVGIFSKDIGIDLGTANTLVFMKGKGIIMREPSVVAVDTRTDTVRYVGQDAKDVIGRTPGSIVAVRPLKDGVIADFDITASMLQIFYQKGVQQYVYQAQGGHLHPLRCHGGGTARRQGSRPEGGVQECGHH